MHVPHTSNVKYTTAQARELGDLGTKGRELRARVKELSDALEKEQAANALISGELQVTPLWQHAVSLCEST